MTLNLTSIELVNQRIENNNIKLVVDLFYGIMVSQCLPPCLRTTATVEKKMTGNLFTEDNLTMVNINFDENVRVTKTSVDQFSFLESLNFLGSNLGLWPGLGLYQILEWVIRILTARL